MKYAAEIKVRAERALGEMLIEQKKTVGLNQGGNPACRDARQAETPSLDRIGISRDLSSRSQQLAAMPEAQFEATIATARDTAPPIFVAVLLGMAKNTGQPGFILAFRGP
jgi:hypothetical protein